MGLFGFALANSPPRETRQQPSTDWSSDDDSFKSESFEMKEISPPKRPFFMPSTCGLPPVRKNRMTGSEHISYASYERTLRTDRTIMVADIWNDVSNSAIRTLFNTCGNIVVMEVIFIGNNTKLAKIVFETKEAADKATMLNKTQQLGGVITVIGKLRDTYHSAQLKVDGLQPVWDFDGCTPLRPESCPTLSPCQPCHSPGEGTRGMRLTDIDFSKSRGQHPSAWKIPY